MASTDITTWDEVAMENDSVGASVSGTHSGGSSIGAMVVTRCSNADLSTKKKNYNDYVTASMLPENKQPCWTALHKGMTIPVIGVISDTPSIISLRKTIFKYAKSQFTCNQCGINSRALSRIFGTNGSFLCAHRAGTVHTSADEYGMSLHNMASDMYDSAINSSDKFTLDVATDHLLSKDRYNYSDPKRPSIGENTYLHYAGNCDTVTNTLTPKEKADLKMFRSGLKKYWTLMYDLLDKLTTTWGNAGQRHATLQRIQTIQELSKEVTYAHDKFGKTLSWIINILRSITKPFCRLTMNQRIQHVICALADSEYGHAQIDDPDDVVSYQYSQMNNTISMLMTKSSSRSGMKSLLKSLAGPESGKRDPAASVSVQQIAAVEKAFGTHFWTRVATVKSLENFYRNHSGEKRFWVTPDISSTSSHPTTTSGFDKLYQEAATAKGRAHPKNKFSLSNWVNENPESVESIPQLITQLEAGRKIYIQCNSEHAVLAHTNINSKYLACTPVKDGASLMWAFMGGTSLGIHASTASTLRRLIAIHQITAGSFSNYILVTDTSRSIVSHIRNNPVMGEWTLSSAAKRAYGKVVSKLRSTTQLSYNTPLGYSATNDYPIVGVGVCAGINHALAHGQTLKIKFDNISTGTNSTIKYYTTPPHLENVDLRTTSRDFAMLTRRPPKFCSNCGTPNSMSLHYCGKCGKTF